MSGSVLAEQGSKKGPFSVYVGALAKAHETSAIANMRTIQIAADMHFTFSFTYPKSLKELDINENLKNATTAKKALKGYYYVYKRKSPDKYTLYVKPASKNLRQFYTDQSRAIRVKGPKGAVYR